MEHLSGPQRGGNRVCVQSLEIKPGGPNPGGPALGKPRSCFNANFNSFAHGLRSGTKVPLALFSFCWNGSLIRLPKKIKLICDTQTFV